MTLPNPTTQQIEMAIEWLVKLQSPLFSDADKQNFDHWLEEKIEHQLAYIEAEALWEAANAVEPMRTTQAGDQASVSKLTSPASKPVAGKKRVWWGSLAAVAMLILAIFVVVQQPQQKTFRTQIGQSESVVLNDGSVVTLNTNTQIRIIMEGAIRKVNLLQGEAFFDIAPDKQRPFVIETPYGFVKVLGTRFNVQVDTADYAAVTVAHGLVSVTPKNQVALQQFINADFSDTNLLKPGEQVNMHADHLDAVITGTDIESVRSWVTGVQIYDGIPLGNVIQDLNRYYSTQLALGDAELADEAVVGAISLHDLDAVLEVFKSSFNLAVHYDDLHNRIILTRLEE